MSRKISIADADKFDYAKFQKDLLDKAKKEKTTLAEISEKRLFHASNYLNEGLRKKKLPLQIIHSLSDWYGLSLKDYEIKPKAIAEPVKTEEKIIKLPNAPVLPWQCEIKVDEEFGTAMMRISKDGETVAVGRSGLYGLDDLGIVQSISYAAHMCYKIVQQEVFKSREDSASPKETKFKDWLKKFEQDMPPYGSFARYVKSNYDKFPAYGRKEMKVFLNMNNGASHINVFEVMFNAYIDWYNGQKQTNAVNIK